jgi:hypothetical protein
MASNRGPNSLGGVIPDLLTVSLQVFIVRHGRSLKVLSLETNRKTERRY